MKTAVSKRTKRIENKQKKMAALWEISKLNEYDRALKKKQMSDVQPLEPEPKRIRIYIETPEETSQTSPFCGELGPSGKAKLCGRDYEELKKRLREQTRKMRQQPNFRLREVGDNASLKTDSENRIPLFLSDLQHLVLYSQIGIHAPYSPARWCNLEKYNRLLNTNVLILENLSLYHFNSYESFFPFLSSKFNHQLEVLSPSAYKCDVVQEISMVPITTTQMKKFLNEFGTLESAVTKSDELFDTVKNLFPVEEQKSSNTNSENRDSLPPSDKFPRTQLLLSGWQMVEENFPLPIKGLMEHKYAGYVLTKEQYKKVTPFSPMFGVDCEMCKTSSGDLELTRVSIVDEKLTLFYESFVKPHNKIVDYLTRYSGITPKIMKNVTKRLTDVQEEIRQILPPDAILVGQSLSNDMFGRGVFVVLVLAFSVSTINTEDDWWTHGVFYQVYPRSFKDSNNDGDGDLKGIIEKLSHFTDAGVTGVWLSPIMASPQVDAGYDISDYYAIDPMFGTMDDLKKLIEEAHKVGLKIILDFVPNHTSNKHEWFLKSENGDEQYKDYYVWANAKEDGGPPNNWISVFRNSAWEWSDKRKQYYLHQFCKEQPDLNYRNPKVQEDMKKVLIFYMELGVDGFRVDAVPFLFEDDTLKDEERSFLPDKSNIDYEYLYHNYTTNLQETFDVIYDWRKTVDEFSRTHGGNSRILMTEAYADLDKTMYYFGNQDGSQLGAHFTFNFFLIMNFNQNTSSAHDIVKVFYNWQNALPPIYASNWVLGNHDNRRIANRLGVENIDGFNMLIQLLPGIAVTYNGEEFGQEDGEVTYEQGKDPAARNESIFYEASRDFERTPLQWDDTTNAGFNEGTEPWLPVSKKYLETNLKSQSDPETLSHYQIYKKLTRKRNEEQIKHGSAGVWALSEDVVVVKRSLGNKHTILAFKLGWNKKNKDEEENCYVPDLSCREGEVVLTNVGSSHKINSKINVQQFKLKPHESLVIDVTC